MKNSYKIKIIHLQTQIQNLESQQEKQLEEYTQDLEERELLHRVKIQKLELQHEELIENTKEKVRMMKNMRGNPAFKVVSPVCPYCQRNDPLKDIVEHTFYCDYIKFRTILELNTEINKSLDFEGAVVCKLNESDDWFVITRSRINGTNVLLYIMHYNEEETEDVFYYNFRYLHNKVMKDETVRCAPYGISEQDALDNNFTTTMNDELALVSTLKIYKA